MSHPSHRALVSLALLSVSLFATSRQARSQGIRLREVAVEWGLDYLHRHGGAGERLIIETMGTGLVIFDFDAGHLHEDEFLGLYHPPHSAGVPLLPVGCDARPHCFNCN